MKLTSLFIPTIIAFTFSCCAQQTDFPVLTGPYLGQEPPGLDPKPFAYDIINGELHCVCTFSPDGKEVYWQDPEKNEIVFMKLENNQWTPPKTVSFTSLLTSSDDPCFSYNGKMLYFTSFRPKYFLDFKEAIWYVERRGDKWSRAKPIGKAINDLEPHWEVSITKDNTIYFGSSGDIYFSKYLNGAYQEPVKLGPNINTDEGDDGTPFIDPDEKYIIFGSTGHPNNVGGKNCIYSDLYISFRNANGMWGKAINMGEKINGPYNELYARVTFDGKYLFFLSYKDNKECVWWVDAKIIEELKP